MIDATIEKRRADVELIVADNLEIVTLRLGRANARSPTTDVPALDIDAAGIRWEMAAVRTERLSISRKPDEFLSRIPKNRGTSCCASA